MWAEEYACGNKVAVEDWAERAYVPHADSPLVFHFSWRKLWRFAGPGWLMSLAYIDPGNLESNVQQGAYTRFDLVWVLWWATFTGLVLQEMSARLGLVTGRDLAQTVKAEYPVWISRIVYISMELAVVGSDVQEVVGSGIAFNLLSFGVLPVWVGCLITALDTFTFLAVGYLGVRYLEALICLFIAVMYAHALHMPRTWHRRCSMFHIWHRSCPTPRTLHTAPRGHCRKRLSARNALAGPAANRRPPLPPPALCVCHKLRCVVCVVHRCAAFWKNWAETGIEMPPLLHGWAFPSMPSYGFTQAIGTLGAVIMPHNLYLHSGLVLSRKVGALPSKEIRNAQ